MNESRDAPRARPRLAAGCGDARSAPASCRAGRGRGSRYRRSCDRRSSPARTRRSDAARRSNRSRSIRSACGSRSGDSRSRGSATRRRSRRSTRSRPTCRPRRSGIGLPCSMRSSSPARRSRSTRPRRPGRACRTSSIAGRPGRRDRRRASRSTTSRSTAAPPPRRRGRRTTRGRRGARHRHPVPLDATLRDRRARDATHAPDGDGAGFALAGTTGRSPTMRGDARHRPRRLAASRLRRVPAVEAAARARERHRDARLKVVFVDAGERAPVELRGEGESPAGPGPRIMTRRGDRHRSPASARA